MKLLQMLPTITVFSTEMPFVWVLTFLCTIFYFQQLASKCTYISMLYYYREEAMLIVAYTKCNVPFVLKCVRFTRFTGKTPYTDIHPNCGVFSSYNWRPVSQFTRYFHERQLKQMLHQETKHAEENVYTCVLRTNHITKRKCLHVCFTDKSHYKMKMLTRVFYGQITTIKIQLSVLNNPVQNGHHYHLIKFYVFSSRYRWKIAHLALHNNHSLTHAN
jgi:hypothetical protein